VRWMVDLQAAVHQLQKALRSPGRRGREALVGLRHKDERVAACGGERRDTSEDGGSIRARIHRHRGQLQWTRLGERTDVLACLEVGRDGCCSGHGRYSFRRRLLASWTYARSSRPRQWSMMSSIAAAPRAVSM